MAEKDIPGGGNRRIKDSMFVDLFGKDVSAKENFLSLYNALHGTDDFPAEGGILRGGPGIWSGRGALGIHAAHDAKLESVTSSGYECFEDPD